MSDRSPSANTNSVTILTKNSTYSFAICLTTFAKYDLSATTDGSALLRSHSCASRESAIAPRAYTTDSCSSEN